MDSTRHMACTWYVTIYSAKIEAIDVYNKNTHLALGIDKCRMKDRNILSGRQHAVLNANFKSVNIG